jgi:hypothetical protein
VSFSTCFCRPCTLLCSLRNSLSNIAFHRFVAHGEDFSFGIAHHQIGVFPVVTVRRPSNKIVLPDDLRQDWCEIHGVTVLCAHTSAEGD